MNPEMQTDRPYSGANHVLQGVALLVDFFDDGLRVVWEPGFSAKPSDQHLGDRAICALG